MTELDDEAKKTRIVHNGCAIDGQCPMSGINKSIYILVYIKKLYKNTLNTSRFIFVKSKKTKRPVLVYWVAVIQTIIGFVAPITE